MVNGCCNSHRTDSLTRCNCWSRRFNSNQIRPLSILSAVKVSPLESTLNEITNKVFNELMQQKTNAQVHGLNVSQNTLHTAHSLATLPSQPKRLSDPEEMAGRSDDWCSENSSGNLVQSLSPSKGRTLVVTKNRKAPIAPLPSVTILSSTIAKDPNSVRINCDGPSSISTVGIPADEANKKPLIAKWKSGVRVQNASSSSATPDSKGNISITQLAIPGNLLTLLSIFQIC